MRKTLRIAPLSIVVLLAGLFLVTNPATGSTTGDENGTRTTTASRILVAAATTGVDAAAQTSASQAQAISLTTTTTTEPPPPPTTEPPPPPTTTAPPPPPPPPPTTTTAPPPPPPPPPPATDPGLESQMLSMINAERSQRGLAPLNHNGALAAVARAHVVTLPANFAHNPNRGSQIPGGWLRHAENVGYNGSLGEVHTALMGSDGHRANILHPDHNNVGIGVYLHGGRVYVTQVFAQY